MAAVFDTLYATSTKNTTPELTPRPFDKNRDGLVIGEGATTLILEEYEHAIKRGAPVYAEIVGFGTNIDGKHITQPTAGTMEKALNLALTSAHLKASDIAVVNGHGTSTEFGDVVESQATHSIFGSETPYHTLKGHFAHTLGACGALEAWLGIEMMRDGWLCPIANLSEVDDRCAPLNYIKDKSIAKDIPYFMSNNFAFGGINTSLIFKRI